MFYKIRGSVNAIHESYLFPGSYRACDHDFVIECNRSRVAAHPDMPPLEPFTIRTSPHVWWPELADQQRNVLLLLDAGFGLLKHLVVDFPLQPLTVVDYSTVDNFRPGQPTPLVLLVFRGSEKTAESIRKAKFSNDKVFDLTAFMMEHELEEGECGKVFQCSERLQLKY